MNHVSQAALLVLAFAASSAAQAIPAGKGFPTRWLLNLETGSDAGLGFKDPHLAVGVAFELPVGRHFELQGVTSFSPDKKYITNDGKSLIMTTTGLYWFTKRLAVTAALHRSNLWTSQFNKSASEPILGIAIRNTFLDFPGRVYLDYVIPTGCQWGASCPLQSNRTQGPEFSYENRLSPHFRLMTKFGFYHIFNQSNNLRPDIPRTGQWTGNVHVALRFEFPAGSMDVRY